MRSSTICRSMVSTVDGVDGAGDVVYVAFEEGGAGAVGELWSVS